MLVQLPLSLVLHLRFRLEGETLLEALVDAQRRKHLLLALDWLVERVLRDIACRVWEDEEEY